MVVYKEEIKLNTDNKITYHNITNEIQKILDRSDIRDGIITVVSPHTTCSVFFEEYSHDFDKDGNDFLQLDLNKILEKIVPNHVSSKTYNYPGPEHYKAVRSWENVDDYLPNNDEKALWNGDAHLKATIIGSSLVIDVKNKQLNIGKTGYYYFVDFDKTRDRVRKCLITVIGE
ncbi:hypothetical protein HMPREF9318_01902 [Streptococcus urinalis FB127-CNA-2]|uniref:Secondary thiamine-phosphate synthase enzyme n=1 Tax=Streptococcus urinalis 2285-97 TaxID=764291 RepID=G5KDD2_9STRE|nr:YjbQ family protein [Streptococcus urinalis]EHJ57289.1 hypothetical protein STRUR_1880 [Streptococcus urinalis 2285-97]EKS17453.1 hypothetical protein HMPREF9318_01902 [Streptococcus urinalis FB127-CNA-2]VEF32725.1 Uncharacterized conserved protein [Streptococcus urinalis]